MKKSYIRYFIIILIIGLAIGCRKHSKEAVSLEPTQKNKINIGNTKDIIQLETTVESTLQNIEKVFVDFQKKKIFILSASNVYIFDFNGSFITKLKSGHGPGEISMANNFTVDTKNELFYVLENSNRIFAFKYNGQFIKSYSMDNFYSLDFQVINNKYLLLHCSWVGRNEKYFVGLYNLSTEKVEKKFLHADISPYPLNVFIGQHNFSHVDNKTYFAASNIFGLFEFNSDSLIKLIEYDLGIRTVPASFSNQFQEPDKRPIFREEALRNNYVPFLTHSFPFNNYYMVIIDDKNRSCYAIDRKNFSKVYLSGQLSDYFDLPKIRSLRRPAAIQDGFIVFAAQPLDFFGPDLVEKSKTIEIAGKTLQINYDDNPFLVLVE